MYIHSEPLVEVNRMRIVGRTWPLYLIDLGKLIGWILYMSFKTNILIITMSHEYQKGGKCNINVAQMTK